MVVMQSWEQSPATSVQFVLTARQIMAHCYDPPIS